MAFITGCFLLLAALLPFAGTSEEDIYNATVTGAHVGLLLSPARKDDPLRVYLSGNVQHLTADRASATSISGSVLTSRPFTTGEGWFVQPGLSLGMLFPTGDAPPAPAVTGLTAFGTRSLSRGRILLFGAGVGYSVNTKKLVPAINASFGFGFGSR